MFQGTVYTQNTQVMILLQCTYTRGGNSSVRNALIGGQAVIEKTGAHTIQRNRCPRTNINICTKGQHPSESLRVDYKR
uniref:Uncharacterized protein n=1 Tax=Aedes aegypti TaxID=7159 RepID=A0A0P6K100_AEDAE